MKVKLDENMPGEAAAFLREQGCDVETVLSESLGGAPDPSVVAAAKREGRILITLDKGIADVTNPLYEGHAGLVLIRAKHPGMTGIMGLLRAHFDTIKAQPMGGRIAVLSSGGVRLR